MVVLVNIFDTLLSYYTDYVLTAPTGITVNVGDTYTISWDTPCGGVDSYTFYYDDGAGQCDNATLDGDKISKDITKDWYEMQVATHRDNMTKCSPGMYS